MNALLFSLAGFLIICLTIFIDAQSDHKRMKAGKQINHVRGWLLRLIGFVPAICVGLALPFQDVLIVVSGTVFYIAFFWLCFDAYLNKLNGQGPWHTGSDDPTDANSDNFLQELTLTQHKVVKLGSLAISFMVYLYCLWMFYN